ncbi:MAG: Wzt carbohydrate-binding domain-containing protein, partial [Flavobacteriaceae bacterium]|nr:Wzt carbohydrate-binding domain-containing protein [Flavobacteriaceae bacterium]
MAAVRSLCTQGIVLQNGRIVYAGSSDDSVNYYLKNSFDEGQKKLLDRKDRKGNQKLLIEDIYILNSNSIKVGEMHSGENYQICLKYKRNGFVDIKQLTIVVQFTNENDDLFTTIASDEQGTTFDELKDIGEIVLDIPRLQFREGRYSLHFMISEKMSFNTPHKTMDYLQNAYTIDVIKGDYWNSGVFNRPKGFIQESSISLR